MAKVVVYGNENLEKALKTFKMRCKREGIFQQCKERRHYVKPSVKRRQSKINRKKKGKTKPISVKGKGKYGRAKK